MITKITNIDELKQMFLEIFLNKTDKVTDISKESVLNAIAFSCAKLAQKCLVNLAVIESYLFPDAAYGQYLDEIAKRQGVSPRFSASGSSTYLRIVGDPGTNYNKNLDIRFHSTSGIQFSLENSFVMPDSGYVYVKVKSEDVGLKTNVDPISLNRMTPFVLGHISCTNEYRAIGGSDSENDEFFRIRIKESVDKLSRGTLSYLEQVLMSINSEVLKVFKGGLDYNSKMNITVVSVSGKDFSAEEFEVMLSKSEQFLSLSDLLSDSNDYSLKLNNPTWQFVDIDFRINLNPAFDVDVIRREIQIQINKQVDYRFWNQGDKVEWENLLYSIKNIEGVRYVPDSYFSPHIDIKVDNNKLPRIRGFVMRDLEGNVISDNNNVLDNFFYPNSIDYSFIDSILTTM